MKNIKDLKIGETTNFYKLAPTDLHMEITMKIHGLDKSFECLSVGNEHGQFAIIPMDDFGKIAAYSHAKLISASPDILEALKKMIEHFNPVIDSRNEYEQEEVIKLSELAIKKATK